MRLWEMVRVDDVAALIAGLDAARTVGYRDNRLTVREIKVQIDGALGSRGATRWPSTPSATAPTARC